MHHIDRRFTSAKPPEQLLSAYAQVMSANPYIEVTRPTYDVLVLTESWIMIWTVVVSIVFFPLGLLSLLLRGRATVTVTAMTQTGTTHVSVFGSARRVAARGYNGLSDWFDAEAGEVSPATAAR